MREILFRGKRKYDGKWFEGYYYLSKNGKEAFILFPCTTFPWWDKAVVDPDTVGQYTGLTDKNGKKIFEGDIVDITQYDSIYHKVHRCCRSKVFFSNFAFRTNAAPEYEDEEPLSYWFWNDCDFEVIGNIHDNPELLKGDNND